jgi:hypothetical protein
MQSAQVEAVRTRLLRWLEERADSADEPHADPDRTRREPDRPLAHASVVVLARSDAGAAASELRRRLWSAEEDALLRALVAQHGEEAWQFVCTQGFVERTHRQCRMRYLNYLAPGLALDEYSAAEDAHLLASVAELGEGKWAGVAARLPGRRPDSVRNRWRSLQGRAGEAPSPAAPRGAEGQQAARAADARSEPVAEARVVDLATSSEPVGGAAGGDSAGAMAAALDDAGCAAVVGHFEGGDGD